MDTVQSIASVLAFSLFAPTLATAAFVTPSWRPTSLPQASSTLTTYQLWTTPTSVSSNNPNTAFNPNGTATWGDTSGNGYVTSTGHLYALNGPMAIGLNVPAYTSVPASSSTQFVLQIENDGGELIPTINGVRDFSSFKIDGTPMSSVPGFAYTELSRTAHDVVTPGGTFTSFDIESEFVFSLTGNASTHAITYPVPANNSQLRVSVDTLAVTPEPIAASLIAVAAPLAMRRRRATR